MATTGWTPANSTSSGVMSDPPPMPVRPTRIPTPRPKTMTIGSMRSGEPGAPRRGRSRDVGVQAALQLIAAGPPPRAAVARPRARGAADRRVALVVERVVGQVALADARPHVAVGPRD